MKLRPLRILAYAICGWLPGGRRHCIACGHRVWRFMPYRSGSRSPALMSALGSIGSDTRNFQCPRCGSHDRERHLMLYLEALRLCETWRGKKVLHFAPEKHLSRFIQAHEIGEYVPCDLYPNSPSVLRVDMECMQFENGSFDVVIANHVLEHVSDVRKALSEIYRVLKPGGHAILQTPYASHLLATWEDAGINTPESRLQAYGQEDHVRLFGRDVFDIIVSAGFTSEVRTHAGLLESVNASQRGVNPREPLFLFARTAM